MDIVWYLFHSPKLITIGNLMSQLNDIYGSLKYFSKLSIGSQPSMIVTDQDAAMKNAINIVLPQSSIYYVCGTSTKNFLVRFCLEFNHPRFKKAFHKTIWDSKIHIEEFEASCVTPRKPKAETFLGLTPH
uniref:Protein FAR1-RELATED SEQUENCE n=1 Tax=Lactuca sativa TaxID=4236 RepID=A0A9R1UY80_LACSA|nr:hypothetical protein LSAT_V11C700369630 [Lactuca sativa]